MATDCVFGVVDGVVPGLGAALKLLYIEYSKLKLGRELCESLTTRFTEFGQELTRIEPDILRRENLLQRLEKLVQETLNSVQIYAKERNLLKRMKKFDKFADDIKLYNERLDSLLGLLTVNCTAKLATLLQWREQYELDAASVATQLQEMTDLQLEIRRAIINMPTKEDMNEFILLVKRDAINEANAGAAQRLKSVLQYSVDEAARRPEYKPVAVTTPPTWLIAADEVALEMKLDDNGDSKVFTAKWRGIQVAVKKYGVLGESPVFDEHLAIWRSLVFLHVAQLYGAGSDDGTPFFVYEYAARQSLDRCWHAFSVAERYGLLYQAALGLGYLHSMKIVHGNMCGANLLVTEHGVVKVFGFGGSYRRENSISTSRKMRSLEAFKAPECLGILPNGSSDGYMHAPNFQSDVYSFGLTVLEVMGQQNPFGAMGKSEIERMKQEGRVPLPNRIDGDALALARLMCVRDPKQRVSLAFVVDELRRLVG